MDTRETVALRIRQLCAERKITPNGLANLSAVPQATIKSILNNESKNPGVVTIKKSFVMVLTLPSVSSSPRLNSIRWNRRSSEASFSASTASAPPFFRVEYTHSA